MARSELRVAVPARSYATAHVVRFDLHQRIQHILMFTSFITLALTGFPQKFPDAAVSQWFIAGLGGLEMTQLVHRVAAWVMIFDGAYHMGYLAYTIVVRRQLRALQMIPTPKDFQDLWHMVTYFVGARQTKPLFGRFSYLEKFDYWAVFWGMMVMGGSGLALMFPVLLSRVFGSQMITVALAAHSDEAVLAVAWIGLVHLFYAHLAPSVFPLNQAIFTGKVPLERYREEHPLELDVVETPVAVREAMRVAAAAEAVAATVAAERPSPQSLRSDTLDRPERPARPERPPREEEK